MKKLRIAQIAPLWFTIPPKKYGGIERVVAFLTDELVKKGHQVTLFAPPGSKTLGKLVTVYPKPLIEAGISWSNPFWNLKNLSVAYQMAKNGKAEILTKRPIRPTEEEIEKNSRSRSAKLRAIEIL